MDLDAERPRAGVSLLVLALVATTSGAVAQRESILCDFEPGSEESYSVVGPWTRETEPSRVSNGRAALRVACSPPESRPGLRIPASTLARDGVRAVRLDVFNAADRTISMALRAEGLGGASHRRDVELPSGWSRVEVDLERLETGKGGRVEPTRLVLLSFGVDDPTERLDLVFDRVRAVKPDAVVEDRTGGAEAILLRFEAAFPERKDETGRAGLVETLRDADVPRRPIVLDRLVLGVEESSLHVDRAIDVLSGATNRAAIESSLRFAASATGRRRARWIEVVARLEAPEADRHVRALLANPTSAQDAALCLAVRAKRADPTLLPALDPELGGPWQLEAARVSCLAALGIDAAFRPTTGFLRSDAARVRADAEAALIAWTGRDLGQKPDAWLSWRDAALHRGREGPEPARYGRSTYYGLPLSGGRTCFVLDVSGSMRSPLSGGSAAYAARANRVVGIDAPTRFDLAREELALAIGSLPARSSFQTIYFNSEVFRWRDEPATADAESKDSAKKHLRRQGPSGATNLHGALVRALDPTPDTSRNFATSYDSIYVLTDGQPTAGRLLDPAEIVADVRDRNRGRLVRIHAIGFGEADCALLRDLSAATGGTFVDLSK
jgi:hypothetical protein